MNALPGQSIPLRSAGLCGDCLVVFDMIGPCPKCNSDAGWVALDSDRASKRINELLDVINQLEGTLRTLEWGLQGRPRRIATRAIEFAARYRSLDAEPTKEENVS